MAQFLWWLWAIQGFFCFHGPVSLAALGHTEIFYFYGPVSLVALGHTEIFCFHGPVSVATLGHTEIFCLYGPVFLAALGHTEISCFHGPIFLVALGHSEIFCFYGPVSLAALGHTEIFYFYGPVFQFQLYKNQESEMKFAKYQALSSALLSISAFGSSIPSSFIACIIWLVDTSLNSGSPNTENSHSTLKSNHFSTCGFIT